MLGRKLFGTFINPLTSFVFSVSTILGFVVRHCYTNVPFSLRVPGSPPKEPYRTTTQMESLPAAGGRMLHDGVEKDVLEFIFSFLFVIFIP